MKLSQLRKAYLMDLASRFTGPFHKKKAASFRTDAVKPTAPASKIPHDVYGELAFRFLEAWQKEKEQKVRICLFGQPGAGKSSLINELIGEKKPRLEPGRIRPRRPKSSNREVLSTWTCLAMIRRVFPKKAISAILIPSNTTFFSAFFRASLRRLIQNFFPVSSGWAGSAFLCAIRSMGFMLLFGP